MHLKFLHGIRVYYSSINIPCFHARFLGLRIDKLRNVCRQNSLRIDLKTLLHLERSCFFIRLTEPITTLDLLEDGLITFRLLLLHLLHKHWLNLLQTSLAHRSIVYRVQWLVWHAWDSSVLENASPRWGSLIVPRVNAGPFSLTDLPLSLLVHLDEEVVLQFLGEEVFNNHFGFLGRGLLRVFKSLGEASRDYVWLSPVVVISLGVR